MASTDALANHLLLDYHQVAARYGFKLGTLASWVARKQIPHIRLSTRMVRFDPADLDAWLEARRVAERPRQQAR